MRTDLSPRLFAVFVETIKPIFMYLVTEMEKHHRAKIRLVFLSNAAHDVPFEIMEWISSWCVYL